MISLPPEVKETYSELLGDPGALAAVDSIAPYYSISPTQIDLFISCPRKWALRYVDGFKTTTEYLLFGIQLHAYLEDWLKDGTQPPSFLANGKEDRAGVLAAKGLHILPKPGTVKVEGKFRFARGPLHYQGVIDYISESDGVGDHKSCASFAWIKTPEDLLDDPQATLYAAYYREKYGARGDFCRLQWNYFSKSDQDAVPVCAEMPWDRVDANLIQLDAVARSIHLTRLLYSAGNVVLKRPAACKGVGRRCWNAPACVLHRRPIGPTQQLVRLRTARKEAT